MKRKPAPKKKVASVKKKVVAAVAKLVKPAKKPLPAINEWLTVEALINALMHHDPELSVMLEDDGVSQFFTIENFSIGTLQGFSNGATIERKYLSIKRRSSG